MNMFFDFKRVEKSLCQKYLYNAKNADIQVTHLE